MVQILMGPGERIVEDSFNYLRFTITLSEAALDAVTVNYRTLLSGTAVDSDLNSSSTSTSNNGTVTFAPGETSKDVLIRLRGDAIDERDEHVTLELYDPTGADLDGDLPVLRSSGVILDNDGAGSNLALFVSDPVIVEGDSGQKMASFEVRLSQPAPSAFSVDYATRDGTALAGSDYVATSGTINFGVSQQTATVMVPIIGDTLDEIAEIFSLAVSKPTGISVDVRGGVGEATILDTDAATGPQISVSGDQVVEDSFNYLRFTVTLSEAALEAVTVSYRTLLSGTAVDSDLSSSSTATSNNGTVTFAPGETSKDIFIRLRGDSEDERDEHVTLELYNPAGGTFGAGQPTARATGVILDNDGVGPNLALFVSDPVMLEGDGGQRMAVFELQLSQPAPAAFTASYATRDGTALAGSDYVATSGSVSFVEGQQFASVMVPVIGDTASEASEIFSLVVTPPGSPAIDGRGAVGEALILDDDGGLPIVTITGDSVVEDSFNYLRFDVTLSAPSADVVAMTYRTVLGTAEDSDLSSSSTSSANNGTLSFSPGETSKSIFIRLRGDSIDERDETIFLELDNAAGALFAGGESTLTAQGFILDNDGVGLNIALSAPDTRIVEPNAVRVEREIIVELSQPSASALTFDVAAQAGTATAGQDFELLDSTVTFAAGQTVAAVTVAVLGDALAEGDETFVLSFTPQTGSAFGGAIRDTVVTIGNGPSYVGNLTPVVAIADQVAAPNEWTRLDSVMSVTDGNGDTITHYELWDDAGRDSWWADGAVRDAKTGYVTTDLSGIWFQGDPEGSLQTLWVRANDGTEWGAWDSFQLATNTPPVATVEDQVVSPFEWTRLSTVVSVSDQDDDAIQMYEIWDSVGSNSWWADGGVVDASAGYATSDLSGIWFQGDSAASSQILWVRAYDGYEWGAWDDFQLKTNTAPTTQIDDQVVSPQEWTHLESVFEATDADGDTIVRYEVWDAEGTNSWWADGRTVDARTGYETTNLSGIWFQGDAGASTQTLWLRANDGTEWSEWDSFQLKTNLPPIATMGNQTVSVDQWTRLDSVLSVSDANGDDIALYEIYDAEGRDSWWADGTVRDASSGYTTDDLSGIWFQGDASASSQTLWVRAYDGHEWGAWDDFQLITV